MVEVDPAVGGDFNGRPANEIFLGLLRKEIMGFALLENLDRVFLN